MIENLRKAMHFVPHLVATLIAARTLRRTGRGGILVFSHLQDVDAGGRDRQMGPLVAGILARGLPLLEVRLVPLRRGELRRARGLGGRPFLSHAAIVGLSRLLRLPLRADRRRSREAAGRLAARFLRGLAPRCAFVIDESGSGQTWVRACRSLGVPVHGIQHGDFQPGNPQYDLDEGAPDPVAADGICVWSPWFRSRLLRISPLYDERTAVVTGRLRFEPDRPMENRRAPSTRRRILLLGEATEDLERDAGPILESLRAKGFETLVRLHPARMAGRREAPVELTEDLLAADLVLGRASSALLEALRLRRPALVLLGQGGEDPAGYVASGVIPGVSSPEQIVELFQEGPTAEGVAEVVWGGAPEDAVEAVLQHCLYLGRRDR